MLIRKVEPPLIHPSAHFVLVIVECARARRQIMDDFNASIDKGNTVHPEDFGRLLVDVNNIAEFVYMSDGRIN
jgi:hypothetical protein